MGDLVAEVEGRDGALVPLALLFAGGARFPTPFLREAVTGVVATLNAQLRANPGLGADRWLLPARGEAVDARVAVLRAVARDHEAAVQAVGAVDLDDLLSRSLAYLDGGVAVAELLLAATTPAGRCRRAGRRPVDDGVGGAPGAGG